MWNGATIAPATGADTAAGAGGSAPAAPVREGTSAGPAVTPATPWDAVFGLTPAAALTTSARTCAHLPKPTFPQGNAGAGWTRIPTSAIATAATAIMSAIRVMATTSSVVVSAMQSDPGQARFIPKVGRDRSGTGRCWLERFATSLLRTGPNHASAWYEWRARQEHCRTSCSESLGTGTPAWSRKRSIREWVSR